VSKHGVPKTIVSNRGSVFTSTFCKQLHEALGSRLDLSTAYHPQTGGQIETTNQILEDMLRACTLDFGGSWEEHLPLAEFSITIVTKVASKWHHLKHYMEESADHPSAGMKWEPARNFIRTMLRKGSMPSTSSEID
jgi:transposase InsO family protein